MIIQPQPRRSPQGLSVGNIVTIAMQASQLNSGPYLLLSLLTNAILIALIIGVAILGIVGAILAIPLGVGNPAAMLWIAIPLGLVAIALGCLASGCYFLGGAAISRLIFRVLQGQTEPPTPMVKQLLRRLWSFTLASLWLGFVLFLAYLVFGAVIGLIGYLMYTLLWPLATAGILTESLAFSAAAALALIILLLVVIFLVATYFVTARLLFVDVIMVLEENYSPIQALSRSWQLTAGQGFRILTALLVYTAVIFPPTILASLVNFVLPFGSMITAVAFLIFWQGVKSVTYYDLRTRNEGLTFDVAATPDSPKRLLRRVSLQTPESVRLDFALGGIGSRAYAYVIDRLIIYVTLTLIFFVGGLVYAYALLPLLVEDLGLAYETVNLWAVAIAVLVYFIVNNGYFIVLETLWQGQTPGKRLAQIRVVRDNGQPIGLKEATLRSLLEPIDSGLLFLGAYLIAFNPSEKRLGDMVAGTLVTQDEQTGAAAAVTVPTTEAMRQVAQTLLYEGNLRSLTPDQYITIREFLQSRTGLRHAARYATADKLATQIRTLVVPETLPHLLEVPPEDFLIAVYTAYGQLDTQTSKDQ